MPTLEYKKPPSPEYIGALQHLFGARGIYAQADRKENRCYLYANSPLTEKINALEKDTFPLQIVPIHRSHLKQVIGIEKESFEFRWSSKKFAKYLKKRDEGIFGMVAEKTDEKYKDTETPKIVSYMVIHREKIPAAKGHNASKKCHILNFAASSDYRHMGIGTKMLDHLMEKIDIQPGDEIIMKISADNIAAQQFLEHQEFIVVDMDPDYTSKGGVSVQFTAGSEKSKRFPHRFANTAIRLEELAEPTPIEQRSLALPNMLVAASGTPSNIPGKHDFEFVFESRKVGERTVVVVKEKGSPFVIDRVVAGVQKKLEAAGTEIPGDLHGIVKTVLKELGEARDKASPDRDNTPPGGPGG